MCAHLAQRYRLHAVIGEGAMGTIWRGDDVVTGAPVAIKVMHPHLGDDPRMVARFEREIDAGRRVHHPNLVSILDHGDEPAFGRYLVMPLLGGNDLRTELGEGLGVRRTVALVEQLLAALEHVHGLGLVHRDIKPDNLRIVADARGHERLLLLDFGLVKPAGSVPGKRRITELGRVFGTPWYMAPEQAMGARIDRRADLYAVGAVMFEMLTGTPPFEGTLVQVLHAQVHTEAPTLPGWVPTELAALVAELLAKDPAARPQSAAAAAQRLRAAMAGVSARPTRIDALRLGSIADLAPPPVSMLRSSRRQGRIVASLFAMAAGIAAAVTLGLGDASAVRTVDPLTTAAAPVSVPADTEVAPIVAEADHMPLPGAGPSTAVPPSPSVPIATSIPEPPVVVEAIDPIAPTEPSRASGADADPPADPPRPRKPAVRKPKPTVEPATPRRLVPSRPPRSVSKLPGATKPAAISRDATGKIQLRPRNA